MVWKPLQITKQIAKREDIRAHTRSQRKQADIKAQLGPEPATKCLGIHRV